MLGKWREMNMIEKKLFSKELLESTFVQGIINQFVNY